MEPYIPGPEASTQGLAFDAEIPASNNEVSLANNGGGGGMPSSSIVHHQGASYDLVPLSLTEMAGGASRLEPLSSDHSQNYRYAIDKSTGNLLIIQDVSNGSESEPMMLTPEIVSSTNLSLSGDALALLQVLDDGHCVLETPSEHLTFHAVDNAHCDDDDDERTIVPQEDVSSVVKTDTEDQNPPLRRALWSRRKITDFIQCIHNHELRLRKSSKIKGIIWNDISKDMSELGHCDCNKDECSKKWSNLYRTWKKVKLRPKEDRQKWQYFNQVTNLVKSISQRDPDKRSSKKSSAKPSTQELILNLMEQNLRHQESVREAEKKFQDQILVMNKERDDTLRAIMEIL